MPRTESFCRFARRFADFLRGLNGRWAPGRLAFFAGESLRVRGLALTISIAFFLSVAPRAGCANLDDILNQISSDLETKKEAPTTPAVSQTAEQPARTESRKPAESKKQSAKNKTKAVVEPKQPPAPETSQIIVHRAADKLPKDFRGHGLAGRFFITATDSMGHPLITSADDTINPFARQFWIVNCNAGLGPNRSFTGNERIAIEVSPSKPLIFVGIFFPGVYNVMLP